MAKPKKALEKNQGKRAKALGHRRGHTIHNWLFQKDPQTSWTILVLSWEDKLGAKADEMFTRTVQHNVFRILNRASQILSS